MRHLIGTGTAPLSTPDDDEDVGDAGKEGEDAMGYNSGDKQPG